MMNKTKYLLLLFLTYSLSAISQEKIDSKHFLILGKVIDNETKDKIINAEVRIVGSDSSEFTLKVDSNGHFKNILKIQVAYSITVSATDYLNAKGKEIGLYESKVAKHLYELEKIENCSGMIPLMIYNKNEFKNPFDPSEPNFNVLNYLNDILKTNPNLIVELIGYRDANEKKKISNLRATNAVNELVKKGINKDRLFPKDAGISNEITERKRESDLNETNITHNRMLIFNIIGN